MFDNVDVKSLIENRQNYRGKEWKFSAKFSAQNLAKISPQVLKSNYQSSNLILKKVNSLGQTLLL